MAGGAAGRSGPEGEGNPGREHRAAECLEPALGDMQLPDQLRPGRCRQALPCAYVVDVFADAYLVRRRRPAADLADLDPRSEWRGGSRRAEHRRRPASRPARQPGAHHDERKDSGSGRDLAAAHVHWAPDTSIIIGACEIGLYTVCPCVAITV